MATKQSLCSRPKGQANHAYQFECWNIVLYVIFPDYTYMRWNMEPPTSHFPDIFRRHAEAEKRSRTWSDTWCHSHTSLNNGTTDSILTTDSIVTRPLYFLQFRAHIVKSQSMYCIIFAQLIRCSDFFSPNENLEKIESWCPMRLYLSHVAMWLGFIYRLTCTYVSQYVPNNAYLKVTL